MLGADDLKFTVVKPGDLHRDWGAILSGMIVAANGGIFATPSGYKPAGAVSIFGATTGQAFAGRRW